jgi:hypothetical protein
VQIGDSLIVTNALIDCRAMGISFVDKDFVHHHLLEQKKLQESTELEIIDGRPIESGTITTMAKLNI